MSRSFLAWTIWWFVYTLIPFSKDAQVEGAFDGGSGAAIAFASSWDLWNWTDAHKRMIVFQSERGISGNQKWKWMMSKSWSQIENGGLFAFTFLFDNYLCKIENARTIMNSFWVFDRYLTFFHESHDFLTLFYFHITFATFVQRGGSPSYIRLFITSAFLSIKTYRLYISYDLRCTSTWIVRPC